MSLTVGKKRNRKKKTKEEQGVYYKTVLTTDIVPFTPEQNLCCEVLRRAIEDLKTFPDFTFEYKDAWRWLNNFDSTEPYSVAYCIDHVSRDLPTRDYYYQTIKLLTTVKH